METSKKFERPNDEEGPIYPPHLKIPGSKDPLESNGEGNIPPLQKASKGEAVLAIIWAGVTLGLAYLREFLESKLVKPGRHGK